MITPKQIEASHGGGDRRTGRKQRRTHSAKQPKQRREKPHAKPPDPLFNALREELGL